MGDHEDEMGADQTDLHAMLISADLARPPIPTHYWFADPAVQLLFLPVKCGTIGMVSRCSFSMHSIHLSGLGMANEKSGGSCMVINITHPNRSRRVMKMGSRTTLERPVTKNPMRHGTFSAVCLPSE